MKHIEYPDMAFKAEENTILSDTQETNKICIVNSMRFPQVESAPGPGASSKDMHKEGTRDFAREVSPAEK